MTAFENRPKDPWSQWVTQWQDAQRQWLGGWHPAAATPDRTRSDAAGLGAPAPIDTTGLPSEVVAATAQFQERWTALWRAAADASAAGGTLPEIASAAPGDRRFRTEAWRTQPYFSLLRQSYLLYAEYLHALAAAAPLPPAEKRKLVFTTRQYIDAIAPTNFPATNPDVLHAAIASDGETFVRGLRNLAEDARKGRISMTDESAFEIGRNIAVTPGSVVYRNALIEVIQYAPTTATVFRRPLVIIPPCINKYYILDLTSRNSFVAHAVAQGHTVFMVSWRNIPPELGSLTWDDYIEDGVLAALRAACEITRSKTVNVLGFCVGGAILTSALAVLAARGDRRVASATLLTTLIDYADAGEIAVYVSREFLEAREPQLMAGQVVDGGELASAFASLRANELVWNYVVGNYLKGETPPAFDLLYWNGDATNLPGPMYAYYLRNLYLDNKLRVPGALEMAGESIDLTRIHVPTYVYASREDHIVPWRSAYRTPALLGGEVTFVLGASGHIAGVVNPPEAGKRNYWRNDHLPDDPDAWLAQATLVPGSWWPHWYAWLAPHGGGRRAAPRRAGNAAHPVLGAAPGEYVRAKNRA